jgi:hypothetical protein
MFDSFIRIDRSNVITTKFALFIIIRILVLFNKSKTLLDLERFFKVNRLKIPKIHAVPNSATLELLYVATMKDFEILALTIPTTLDSMSNFRISRVSIIVPDEQVETLRSSIPKLPVEIVLILESSLISDVQAQELKEHFDNRYGWVLQQVLKILFVSQSDSDGVMVVDADTALLSQRNWLDLNGKQVLTPTWEFHPPYYKFLEDHNLIEGIPGSTFVSHHMIFQPHVMNEIFVFLGWSTNLDIIKSLTSLSLEQENSPFSIDYELYAQYLYRFYPEKVSLEKWGNLESLRKLKDGSVEDFVRRVIINSQGKYASVSFHSYLA